MKELTFNHGQWQLRCFMDAEDEVLLLASDVAQALGYGHVPHMTRILDDDEKGVRIEDTPGGKQKVTVITESGLYHATLKSRKAEAQMFRKWVTSVVLPQIRKTGGYIPVTREDDEKTILAKAVKILMKTVEMQKEELASQDIEIARLAPRAEYAEEVLLSPTCYTMTEVAKSLSMTVRELQRFLHSQGIIYRNQAGRWML